MVLLVEERRRFEMLSGASNATQRHPNRHSQRLGVGPVHVPNAGHRLIGSD